MADPARITTDLAQSWEVLAEVIQTVMRRYGIVHAYEQLKALTRGRHITPEILWRFISKIDVPDDARARLLKMKPSDYIGLAVRLAREV